MDTNESRLRLIEEKIEMILRILERLERNANQIELMVKVGTESR